MASIFDHKLQGMPMPTQNNVEAKAPLPEEGPPLDGPLPAAPPVDANIDEAPLPHEKTSVDPNIDEVSVPPEEAPDVDMVDAPPLPPAPSVDENVDKAPATDDDMMKVLSSFRPTFHCISCKRVKKEPQKFKTIERSRNFQSIVSTCEEKYWHKVHLVKLKDGETLAWVLCTYKS